VSFCAALDDFKCGAPGRSLGPIDCRTKTERPATILLPNGVAEHDIKRDVMDGSAKIAKENSTA
jgi:hypothetical protein